MESVYFQGIKLTSSTLLLHQQLYDIISTLLVSLLRWGRVAFISRGVWVRQVHRHVAVETLCPRGWQAESKTPTDSCPRVMAPALHSHADLGVAVEGI